MFSSSSSLQVFGRQDKSLYVSGCGESQVIGTEALRSDGRPSPQDCPPDMARAAAAQSSLKEVGYGRSQADVAQACVRPMSPDGVPIVGNFFGNVYIATGGGPWGITWGPLMGKSLASLINDDDDPPISWAIET
jgi:glycine/D-amino acid oxidase-like deaminating enzyme